MIFRIFKIYSTGKTIYNRVLKPIYEELRKDAYATEDKRTRNRIKKKSNAVNQKPKRRNSRKANP
jgi:hypothetical protein